MGYEDCGFVMPETSRVLDLVGYEDGANVNEGD